MAENNGQTSKKPGLRGPLHPDYFSHHKLQNPQRFRNHWHQRLTATTGEILCKVMRSFCCGVIHNHLVHPPTRSCRSSTIDSDIESLWGRKRETLSGKLQKCPSKLIFMFSKLAVLFLHVTDREQAEAALNRPREPAPKCACCAIMLLA